MSHISTMRRGTLAPVPEWRSSRVNSDPRPRSPEHGLHRGDGALAQTVVDGDPFGETKVLSGIQGSQSVIALLVILEWTLSCTKEKRAGGSVRLGAVGEAVLFYSQRRQAWPEFLEAPIWSSWNCLACLFSTRYSRVGTVFLRGTDYQVFQPGQKAGTGKTPISKIAYI